jgi:hypothetical protein
MSESSHGPVKTKASKPAQHFLRAMSEEYNSQNYSQHGQGHVIASTHQSLHRSSWRDLSSCLFTTPMGPAIVVVTTINFDSLPQPQDSPFSRDGSDSPVPNPFTVQAEVKQILRLEDFPSCAFG